MTAVLAWLTPDVHADTTSLAPDLQGTAPTTALSGTDGGSDSRLFATFWFHTAAMASCIAMLCAVVRTWPAFGQRREGASGLGRLHTGPADGCLAAALGGFAVWGLGLGLFIPVAEAAGMDSFTPPTARRHVPLRCRPELIAADVARASLECVDTASARRAAPFVALRANARILSSIASAGAAIELALVRDTGEEIGRAAFRGDGSTAEFALEHFDVSAAEQLAFVQVAGSPEPGDAPRPAAYFPGDSIELIGEATTPGAWNSLQAHPPWLAATLLGLGVLCGARRHLGAPILVTAAASITALSALTGLAPVDLAITTLARGERLDAVALTLAATPAGALAFAALLGAAWWSRRRTAPALSSGEAHGEVPGEVP